MRYEDRTFEIRAILGSSEAWATGLFGLSIPAPDFALRLGAWTSP